MAIITDKTPIGLKIDKAGIPYIYVGDFALERDPTTQIENEIRNGLIENERAITDAVNDEVRANIINDIFVNYPFIKSFSVTYYNNIGDFKFVYGIDFNLVNSEA